MSSYYNSYNGEIIEAGKIPLNSRNRSFRYGDGLFETIRIVEGKICFFNDHFDRLQDGFKVLELSNFRFSKSQLLDHLNHLISLNNINKGGRIRLHFWRQEGGFYSPTNNNINWLVEVESFAFNFYPYSNEGMLLDIYQEILKPINPFANIKSANALLYVKAGLFKNKKKVEECLILNDKGFLSEGISSNVFMVFGESIITPSLKQGCLNGVMRKQIIKLANFKGLQIKEGAINPDLLLQADEVFFTNVIQGIAWAKAYRNKRYFNKTSKSLNETLNKLLLNSLLDLREN